MTTRASRPRTTAVKTISRLERMPSSSNGNPRFRAYFTDGTDAATVVDADCAYGLENRENLAPNEVEVSFSRRGQIEYVTPVKR
jgi:hypothetical protein